MQTELPTTDQIKEWLATNYYHLNPDLAPYFWMGVEALYVKLGGQRFLEIRMPPKETKDEPS
jgi:hypothetical protein